MYWLHNKGKSVVAERFFRTLKNKIFIQMKAISKNVYFNVLDDIVNEYNNTVHRAIKMKPIDVKDNIYVDSEKEVNDKDPKFKAGDHVRISKYKNNFAKGYAPNWSEEVFIISKIKNTVPWTCVINGEEIIGTFYEKEQQKTNKKEFRIEKVIKRKGDILYVKWKGYNNSFNRWINKKDLVWFYCIKIGKCYPKSPYKAFGKGIKIKVDLLYYATKTDLKNVTHVDISSFALKRNLANLKTEVDKLDIDKLVPVPTDLSKLSNVVKNDVVKKLCMIN